MAEEATNSTNTVPVQAAVPEAPAVGPDTARKGSPLLVFLTVLLILVGIADVILWGMVGYYLLVNTRDDGGEPARIISTGGEPAQSASGTGADFDDGAKRDAVEVYI